MNTLNVLKTSTTGLEIINYVQTSPEIQEIHTHSGDQKSENATQDLKISIMHFNIDNERVFTTAGMENSPLHIKPNNTKFLFVCGP